MKTINILFATLFSCILLSACNSNKSSKPTIIVTIEPQRYWADLMSEGRFDIVCILPKGQSPEAYEPTPRQMTEMSDAAAYFRVGKLGFELSWADRITEALDNGRNVDLSKGMHSVDNDPHIWLSISGARTMTTNMLDAFISLDPEGEAIYRGNYEKITQEINEVEQYVKQKLSNLDSRTFAIYHPVMTYYASDFRLNQLFIEVEGKEPSASDLKDLIDSTKAFRVKTVFVQQEFDKKNAKTIAQQTGCRLVSIAPLSYNWAEAMKTIADELTINNQKQN